MLPHAFPSVAPSDLYPAAGALATVVGVEVQAAIRHKAAAIAPPFINVLRINKSSIVSFSGKSTPSCINGWIIGSRQVEVVGATMLISLVAGPDINATLEKAVEKRSGESGHLTK
jgi:hypothetical protein